ncbi:hypothetical protein K3169_19720 [Pseudomonas phytophila]|uniref:Phage abortive infection protein n=1 Tax=Pseudomonas phytophila TaxID=2867264 RepID=A0ABY6F9N3_9PSED|nr:putative phage abortive infection protein [Pseudomonas phytophila]UXZ94582.1 hypothetical protein K3169_19720 [Pseudomonas phytophila]
MDKDDASLKSDGPSVDKVVKILAVIVSVAMAAVVCAFGAYFYNFGSAGFSESSADWGTFGDFIGGFLNPLLSFFGLIALLLTIVLQGKELELTRKELKRSADSQEKAQVLLDAQIKTQVKQQFESTYFSLLSQHNKMLEDIQEVNELKKAPLIHHVERAVYKKWLQADNFSTIDLEDFSRCTTYFRILHQVMKFNFVNNHQNSAQDFVDFLNGEPMTSDEMGYAEILKAHLNGPILKWIAFYGIADDKHPTYLNFSWLVRRYNLLENIKLDSREPKLERQLRDYHGFPPQF